MRHNLLLWSTFLLCLVGVGVTPFLPSAAQNALNRVVDTNWPHYGHQGMIYRGTNYVWGQREVEHRIRWHDGFYGPELVRLELATNSVPGATIYDPTGHFRHIHHTRVLRYITNDVITNEVVGPRVVWTTNEVVLKFLGIETRPIPPTLPNCCCCCTNVVVAP